VVFVGLLVTLLFLPSSPDTAAPSAKIITFYRHHHTQVYVMAALVAYAGAAVVLYLTSVAAFLRRRGSDLLATTINIGAAVCASGLLLASGALMAANDGPQTFPPDVARTFNILQSDLFWPMALGGLAIATISMGVAMLRTGALPKALGIVTTIVGVVACTGFASWFAFMASGPLTLVIAGYVYSRSGRPEAITMPDIPATRTAAEAVTLTTDA
jgi:hypothetical protein